MDPQIRKGTVLTALTAIFFGLNTAGIRWFFLYFEPIGPENVIFWGLLGAILLATPLQFSGKKNRLRLNQTIHLHGKVILVVILLSSGGAFLWILGLERLDAGVVSLLAKSQAVHSLILGSFLLKEKHSAFEVLGVLLALTGVGLISTLKGGVTPVGVVLVLTSALIYAFQSLVVKRFAPGLNGREFTYLRASGMVLTSGLIFGVLGRLHSISPGSFLFLSLVSLTGLIVGRSFYFQAHNYLGIGRLSTLMLLEPIFVLTLSFFLLGETLPPRKILGGLLILLGIWMTVRRGIPLSFWYFCRKSCSFVPLKAHKK